MKKKSKIILVSLFAIFLFLTIILVIINRFLGIVFGVGSLIVVIVVLVLAYTMHNEKYLYNKELNRILEAYKPLLVKSATLPSIDKKRIITINSIVEMITKQKKLRKPIYYKTESKCCVFSLSDSLEVYLFILKVNDSVVSELETLIHEREERISNKDNDFNIINEVAEKKVTLEDSKEFKVSPANMMHVTDEMREEIEIREELTKIVEEDRLNDVYINDSVNVEKEVTQERVEDIPDKIEQFDEVISEDVEEIISNNNIVAEEEEII